MNCHDFQFDESGVKSCDESDENVMKVGSSLEY
jgi:hypothetical protein